MELLSVKQKSQKHSKINKKKPLKIVYISDPVKFTVSPNQFRSIVQQLTGKHSTAVDLPAAYGEVSYFSTPKDVRNEIIPAQSQIEHRTNMPDRCNYSASCFFYGYIEAAIDIGEKTTPELFMSYDCFQYDNYAEAGFGLSKV